MTNSHSKTKNQLNKNNYSNMSFENNSPSVQNRHSNNCSPNYKKHYGNNSHNNNSSSMNGSFFANNNSFSRGQQKSPKNTLATSNAINNNNFTQTPNKYNNNNTSSPSNNNRSHRPTAPISIMNGGHSPTRTPTNKFYSNVGSPTLALSPSNPDYFAGSKCFDAPNPEQLPAPPSHWCSQKKNSLSASSCAVQFAKASARSNQTKMIPMPV